jgi:hypothetical protein
MHEHCAIASHLFMYIPTKVSLTVYNSDQDPGYSHRDSELTIHHRDSDIAILPMTGSRSRYLLSVFKRCVCVYYCSTYNM